MLTTVLTYIRLTNSPSHKNKIGLNIVGSLKPEKTERSGRFKCLNEHGSNTLQGLLERLTYDSSRFTQDFFKTLAENISEYSNI